MSNLVHGLAFGTPKFYIALYGKIFHELSKGKALFILHVMIGMLSSHLMQSEIIIYGLVRKCVKLSPFS